MTSATLFRLSGPYLTVVAAAVTLTVSVQTSPAAPGVAEAVPQASSTDTRLEPLFTQATRTAGAPRSDMDPHVLRRAALHVSEKALASGIVLTAEAHILNLFPDVQILAMRSRVESRSRASYSWFGSIPGDDFGRAIITVNNGKLGAAVTHNGRRYLVLPSPDGLHDVFEIDERTLQEGDDVDPGVPVDGGGTRKTGGTQTAPVLQATPLDSGGLVRIVGWDLVARDGGDLKFEMRPDDGGDIDVMVVYTHLAAEYADWSHDSGTFGQHQLPYNLVVRIQLGIDLANQSFFDSGVPIHLNVIGDPYEDPSYQEDGVAFTDLTAVRAGQLAGVHYEREVRAADLVMLVTARALKAHGDKSICGRSTWVRPWSVSDEAVAASYGYFLVKSSCLTSFTPAHEIGHQLGAAHDWYTLGLQGALGGSEAPLGHGYAWFNGNGTRGFYTIMAYDWLCRDYVLGYAQGNGSCSRVGRWSDPEATHDVYGVPLGKSELHPSGEPAHDAKTTRLNRKAVANYRNSACRATNGC